MTLEEERALWRLEQRLRIPALSAHQLHVANGKYPVDSCEKCQSLLRAREPKMPVWAHKRPGATQRA